MCPHRPPCPPADHPDRGAAQTVAFHPEQGWSLLCNGVTVFDDTGEVLPGGRVANPNRQAPHQTGELAANATAAPRDLDIVHAHQITRRTSGSRAGKARSPHGSGRAAGR